MIEEKDIEKTLKKLAKEGKVKVVGKNEKGETLYTYKEAEAE